jgi:hypothetical protein
MFDVSFPFRRIEWPGCSGATAGSELMRSDSLRRIVTDVVYECSYR